MSVKSERDLKPCPDCNTAEKLSKMLVKKAKLSLLGLRVDWSNCGEFLAVSGFTRLPNLQCRNELHFYGKDGRLLHWVSLPSQVCVYIHY